MCESEGSGAVNPRRVLIMCICFPSECAIIPADGFMRGTMTGALLCSLGVVRDELVEEEEGEEDGTLGGSLSPLFIVRTVALTLASRLLGFGKEFSERREQNKRRFVV